MKEQYSIRTWFSNTCKYYLNKITLLFLIYYNYYNVIEVIAYVH